MIQRLIVYDRESLQSMRLDQLATALNFRNDVTGEKALYRNEVGELFAVRVDIGPETTISVYNASETRLIAVAAVSGVGSVLAWIEDVTSRGESTCC